mmetsp:Transcript_92587/g.264569  ORF Transcript_92587/g.264569 Transcript_92587/m.264569 type:complete len:106 (-) Transcript_92587:239-556(-)
MSGGGGAAGEVTTYIQPNDEREPPGETSLLLEGTDAELMSGKREEKLGLTKRKKRFLLLALFWAWITVGCLFYISVDQGWNVIESVFFCDQRRSHRRLRQPRNFG